MKSIDGQKQAVDCAGQAMVEFVIILIFIMAMCAGMLASMRLLTFQFWAQQEARYLAWEQTWAPHDFNGDPVGDPIGKLDDGAFFGRPEIVSNRDKTKDVTDDSNVSDLLSWLVPSAKEESGIVRTIGETDSAPVMLAKADSDSIWNRKTDDWFKPGGSVDRALSMVGTAFAREDVERKVRSEGYLPNDNPENPRFDPDALTFGDTLAPKLQQFFELVGVGPQVCAEFKDYAARENHPEVLMPLIGSDCAGNIERGLANQIAQTVDVKDFFRGYEQNIQSGFTPAEAIQISVREEVASGFYSLFDTIISGVRPAAIPGLLNGSLDAAQSLSDASTSRYLSNLRYIGSSAAIAAITAGVGLAAGTAFSTDAASIKSMEDSITGILHTDADVALGSPFFLSPVFLPVPPTFGAVAPGLQDSIMKNLLSQSEDDGVRDEEIENSNKMVEVTYKAAGGLFQLATTRIKNIENAQLTARYYLVTQEWHQKRRENKTGDYRDKGTQFDPKSDETEEAVMRRRVLGLWLFPTDPAALVEPISLLPGLGFLQPIFQAFEPLGSVIGFIKGFVTDNPLFDIAQALSEIPVIGDIIPVPPVWPAVRPDAYPGSTEMTENDPDKPDKLMHNEERNFSDYVTEQRDNNPEAKPAFN